MVSFRGARKLRSYLVWAKVYTLERLDHAVVAKISARFALMLLKRILLPVLLPIRYIRLIICLTVVQNF